MIIRLLFRRAAAAQPATFIRPCLFRPGCQRLEAVIEDTIIIYHISSIGAVASLHNLITDRPGAPMETARLGSPFRTTAGMGARRLPRSVDSPRMRPSWLIVINGQAFLDFFLSSSTDDYCAHMMRSWQAERRRWPSPAHAIHEMKNGLAHQISISALTTHAMKSRRRSYFVELMMLSLCFHEYRFIIAFAIFAFLRLIPTRTTRRPSYARALISNIMPLIPRRRWDADDVYILPGRAAFAQHVRAGTAISATLVAHYGVLPRYGNTEWPLRARHDARRYTPLKITPCDFFPLIHGGSTVSCHT